MKAPWKKRLTLDEIKSAIEEVKEHKGYHPLQDDLDVVTEDLHDVLDTDPPPTEASPIPAKEK